MSTATIAGFQFLSTIKSHNLSRLSIPQFYGFIVRIFLQHKIYFNHNFYLNPTGPSMGFLRNCCMLITPPPTQLGPPPKLVQILNIL